MKVTRTIELSEVTCAACSMLFAVPEEWERNRREVGDGFFCPNGHPLTWGKSTNDKLRAEVATLQSRLVHAEDQRVAAERDAQAARAEAERQRKRAANGVCPCCNRTFANLARHMRGQHPDYTTSDARAEVKR